MQNKWSEIETYNDLEPEAKRFVDWLITPKSEREVGTQLELAEELAVDETTFSKWKNRKKFNEIREERYREIRAPQDLEDVINATRNRGINGEGKEANEATEIYLNWYYNKDFTKGTKVNQSIGSDNRGLKIEIDEAREDDDELDDAQSPV